MIRPLSILCLPLLLLAMANAKVVTYATHPSFDLPGLTKAQEDEEFTLYFEGLAEANCGIDLVRVPWGRQTVEIYSAVLSRPDGLVDLGRNDPSTFSIWLHSGTRDGGRKDFYLVDKHGKSARGMAGRAALHEFGHLLPEFRSGTQDGNGHLNNNACIMDIDLVATSMCPQEIAVFRKHYGPPKTKPAPTPGTFAIQGQPPVVFGDGKATGLVGRWRGGKWGVGLYEPTTSTFLGRFSMTGGYAEFNFPFGSPGLGLQPVIADYDGDGSDNVGVYNPKTGWFYFRKELAAGRADYSVQFGPIGAQALSGQLGVHVKEK